MPAPPARRRWLACALVFVGALAATVPTTGDIGLTWDEPVYRDSQILSTRWWEQLIRARSWSERAALLDADTLAYHWPYGRFGINFHPPLAGQASVLTHAAFGRWMKDMPARRLASVIEYALTIAILFGFLAARYGPWVGGVAAGALLTMPRVYGDAHVAGTDMPGLLLWAAAAVAAWKGLNEPAARRWRVAVGVLLGLAFVEKLGAVAVLLPILLWIVAARLPRSLRRKADWIDGLATSTAMMLPLGVAFGEILRLMRRLPGPKYYDVFDHTIRSPIPGAILLAPLLVWLGRRALGRLRPRHPVWGAERPALETWTAILAFAPAVGWLGNPAWWREALPRLAHYAMLNSDRRGALPDIRVFYLGRTYLYSLPWHNAWVLIAVTVPAGILIAALVGLISALGRSRRDRLPLYFLVHLATLPALRMLPTPAHDGVRLLLPTFFFLAAFAGWGLIWLADGFEAIRQLALSPGGAGSCSPGREPRDHSQPGGSEAPEGRHPRPVDVSARSGDVAPPGLGMGLTTPDNPGAHAPGYTIPPLRGSDAGAPNRPSARPGRVRANWPRRILAGLVLGWSGWQLAAIHPFELSYYNELIGGPPGAWRRGFELSYWYDAFNPGTLAEINAALPRGAAVGFSNEFTQPPTFATLQALGALRGDLDLNPDASRFTYKWLLTHDSKANAFTRLLFAMTPWYERRPPQLGGLRVATVADPVAVSRAWAVQLLVSNVGPRPAPTRAPLPGWLRRLAPGLGRFWGEGLTQPDPPGVDQTMLDWARTDPKGLRAAARIVADRGPIDGNPGAQRLRKQLSRHDDPKAPYSASTILLEDRPRAVVEAVEILIARPEAIRAVLLKPGYTDPATIGGDLDRSG